MCQILFSSDWMEHSPLITQESLPNPFFDHLPIMLRLGDLLSDPRPFRFEFMWLEILGFKEKINLWWEEIKEEGSTNYVFGKKLKMLKHRICR